MFICDAASLSILRSVTTFKNDQVLRNHCNVPRPKQILTPEASWLPGKCLWMDTVMNAAQSTLLYVFRIMHIFLSALSLLCILFDKHYCALINIYLWALYLKWEIFSFNSNPSHKTLRSAVICSNTDYSLAMNVGSTNGIHLFNIWLQA